MTAGASTDSFYSIAAFNYQEKFAIEQFPARFCFVLK